jgi:putative colanic acid biosynthesis UDP-glucose lipid carrier transferase
MRNRHLRSGILIADVLWVFGAWGLAIGFRYTGGPHVAMGFLYVQSYSHFLIAAVAAWIPLYFEMNLDGFRGGWHFPAILSKLIVGITCLMLVVLAFAFVTNHRYSRLVLFYFSVLFFLGTIAVRCLARLLVASHLSNLAENRCVIVGRGPVARELARKIASHPEFPFSIIGFLYPGRSEGSNGSAVSFATPYIAMKTLGVLALLTREKVQKLIIAMPPNSLEIQKLISQCREADIQVYLVPEPYDLYLSRAELIEIDGLPLLSLREHPPAAVNFWIKRMMDVVLSLAILVLLSPVFVLAGLIVYLKKGRAFRTELRCGQGGTLFRMYRLNIDRHGANPLSYERSFVRWSLTELPQLWNVLQGDMSLVGPRPESPERTKHYSGWQRQRLKVRPGVTGLAQVHGLREQHPSEDKTRFDLQYISSWSPFLDLSILVQTLWTLFSRGLIQEPPQSENPLFDDRGNESVVEEVANVDRS